MRRLFTAFALMFLVAGLANHAFAKRVALVIGNAAYNDPWLALPLSTADADGMAAVLQSYGFEVILEKNANAQTFRASLDAFEARMEQGDVGLFYYSGHGLQFAQRNYLAPVDAAMAVSDRAPDELLPVEDVLAAMERARLDYGIVILDACNDTGLEVPGGLARMEQPTDTFIAYAADVGQLSSSGGVSYSFFTQYLLAHLPDLQNFAGCRNIDVDLRTSLQAARSDMDRFLNTIEAKLGRPVKRQRPPEFSNLSGRKSPYLYRFSPPFFEPFRDCYESADNQILEGPQLIAVEAQSFAMGSDGGRDNEGPVRQIDLRRDFAIGVAEVTFTEWDYCLQQGGCTQLPDDQGWGRGDSPVINLSWDHAKQYAAWLSKVTGRNYRLPTEAEWEFAARAGGDGGVGSGQWGSDRTTPSAQFPPNAWGIHDMQGNVFEWIEDCYAPYEQAANDGSAWGDAFCTEMVVRGGSFKYGADIATVTFRGKWSASSVRDDLGFRIVRDLN